MLCRVFIAVVVKSMENVLVLEGRGRRNNSPFPAPQTSHFIPHKDGTFQSGKPFLSRMDCCHIKPYAGNHAL